MSITLAQYLCNNEAKMCPRDDYVPGLLTPVWPISYGEHNHKRFKSLPRSLRIAYDFSDALKTHLNVCRRVCCPLNDQIR